MDHGWMSVISISLNVVRKLVWMLRRIVGLGLSLVSGGMVLSCVVMLMHCRVSTRANKNKDTTNTGAWGYQQS